MSAQCYALAIQIILPAANYPLTLLMLIILKSIAITIMKLPIVMAAVVRMEHSMSGLKLWRYLAFVKTMTLHRPVLLILRIKASAPLAGTFLPMPNFILWNYFILLANAMLIAIIGSALPRALH